MSFRTQRFVFPLLALVLTACASAGSGPTRDDGGVTRRDGAIILSGVALNDGRGTLLSAIRGKVPNLRIQRPSGRCPQITLRSSATLVSDGLVNPHVYVDGTRTSDTCILESLRTQDVESVEVYPMGVTSRPGYGRHAHGLILVFMRSS
jgi:hypothetical protein